METALKKEVRIALAIKGKTQSWLAQHLEINEAQLSRILNGRDEPKKQIDKIRKFLEEV
ncbi:XRE family transcriptional regulator [Enterococcus sp. DIV1420a]|uniref:XRE family transcriptional regulator n=1 Tax=Enterococcus sp. DIV1420a TaxID=2774672 RepID=UPI0036D736F6